MDDMSFSLDELTATLAAHEGPPHPRQRRPDRRRPLIRLASARPRLALVAIAVSVALAGTGAALAYEYFGPSPGFSAGLSSLDDLPQASWPSSMPRLALERSAAAVGITGEQAAERLRLLQSGLDLGPGRTTGGGALYAFQGQPGTACIFLTGQGDTCVTPESVNYVHSVMWALFPGYPGERPAVVGLVADNVEAVDLELNGQMRNVPIINNSVYASLGELMDDERIALKVTFADGSTQSIPIPNALK